MKRRELIVAVNDMFGTLKSDFGVKPGVSLFLVFSTKLMKMVMDGTYANVIALKVKVIGTESCF